MGWPIRFFIFSVFILAVLVAGYLGLAYGYKPFLQKDLQKIKNETDLLNQQVSPTQREEFIAFYSQIENLKMLISKHVYASKVFPFLETNTRKDVAYNSMDLDITTMTASFGGIAANYESLASQLDIFKNLPEVKDVLISGATAGQNGVGFQLQIIFNNDFFR